MMWLDNLSAEYFDQRFTNKFIDELVFFFLLVNRSSTYESELTWETKGKRLFFTNWLLEYPNTNVKKIDDRIRSGVLDIEVIHFFFCHRSKERNNYSNRSRIINRIGV